MMGLVLRATAMTLSICALSERLVLGSPYIQTSARFAPSARDAQQRGWQVRTLAGTHLHPLIAARDTADALSETVQALVSS